MPKARVITEENKNLILCELSYDPNTGVITWNKNEGRAKLGAVAGYEMRNGYILIEIGHRPYLAHRLAFVFMSKPVPEYVDHINGVRNDNRWCNLRPCNQSKNGSNRGKQSNNTSGYKGVSWNKLNKKWEAYITVEYKRRRLGFFDDPIEAHKAYCEASKEYFKEFSHYG